MVEERVLPHDIDAEEAVIGSLLIDGEAIYRIAPFLKPADFYREKNRWAYEACSTLYERNEALNEITVAHELARQNRLEASGGPPYLSLLVSQVPTSLHIEHYAQIVYRTSMMRRLIDAADHITALGYKNEPDVEASLDRAEDILFKLRHGQSPRDFVHIREVLDKYFEESEGVASKEGAIASVFTGFTALDEILGGLQRSDMVVLGALTSRGKTSLALNIARNTAASQGAHVAIFSLEMAKEQLVQRLLSSESGVDAKRLRLGLQNEAEERQIIEATGVLSELPIYVDDSPIINIVEMRSKARRLHNERGIDLIIVDYLQLVHGNGRFENRVQEMSQVSQAMKSLARELNVPLLALSQLSRAPMARASHIPQLSDLRESGSIEQDADVVLFIHREEMDYNTKEEWEKHFPDRDYPKGVADIIVAKHRHGPMGTKHLRFLERMAKFTDFEFGEGG